jgi:hypothetical protein
MPNHEPTPAQLDAITSITTDPTPGQIAFNAWNQSVRDQYTDPDMILVEWDEATDTSQTAWEHAANVVKRRYGAIY